MRIPKLIVVGSGDPNEGGETWKERCVGEGSIMGEFYKLFVVRKGWCVRCKRKTHRRKNGKYYCEPPEGCGAIYSHERELIAPDD